VPGAADAIREAARTGRLSAVTLFPCSAGWQANARRADKVSWNIATDPDPIVALEKALGVAVEKPEPSAWD
jgi:hypothetical protein